MHALLFFRLLAPGISISIAACVFCMLSGYGTGKCTNADYLHDQPSSFKIFEPIQAHPTPFKQLSPPTSHAEQDANPK
jgi:hypothetical protein